MNTLDKVYDLTIDIKNIDVKYNSYAKFFDDDRETSVIRIKLLNDKTPMNLENCIVEAYFILADNTYHNEACKIINSSEGVVELQLCQKCLVKGENIVRLSILKDNEISNTPIITYEVRKGLYSDNPNFNDDPLTPILSQMLLDVKVTKVNQIELQERYEKSLPKIEGKIKEVESLINRVDTAIASGTQDLEVKEARVGENGKSYAKLGDRLDEVDSQLEHKVNNYDLFVNVKDFGVVGNGVNDDTEAMLNAFNYVKSLDKKIPIFIPPDLTCLISSPLPLFDGLYLYSTINNSEFGNKAIIINKTSNLFEINSDVSDVNIHGLEFRGNSANKDTYFIREDDFASGKILKYSNINNCGFNYFKTAIKGRILGCKITNNFFNNGFSVLHLAGSDNIIQNNFIDNANNLNKDDFLVKFESLSLTKFENNYLTGAVAVGNGAMLMSIKYGEGLVISRNWLDYSEGCAIYFYTTHDHIIRDNFVRGNCRNPFSQYDAIFTLFDCNNICFSGNQFIDQVNGNRTFSLRKSKNVTKNITIRDNIYKNGYNLKIYKPSTECEDIFIDEPTTTYNKGKYWNGVSWNSPFYIKNFVNLSLNFGEYGTISPKSSKSFDVRLSEVIPNASIISINFYSYLEDGIICDCKGNDSDKIKIRFTNVKDTSVTLSNKQFTVTVLY